MQKLGSDLMEFANAFQKHLEKDCKRLQIYSHELEKYNIVAQYEYSQSWHASTETQLAKLLKYTIV